MLSKPQKPSFIALIDSSFQRDLFFATTLEESRNAFSSGIDSKELIVNGNAEGGNRTRTERSSNGF